MEFAHYKCPIVIIIIKSRREMSRESIESRMREEGPVGYLVKKIEQET